MVRIRNTKRDKKRKKVRKYELDKIALNKYLREIKEQRNISYNEIAKFLGVSKHNVVAWFDARPDHIYYSEIFSKKWYELKFLLEIDDTKFDKEILTYTDPRPLNDTFMCSNHNCDMVSCNLQRIEESILNELRKVLKEFRYYVDNYEEEIIRERLDNQKTMAKLNNKLDSLKQERKNLLRARNREEYSYEDYLELKQDIESEIDEIVQQLEEFENDDEAATLTRYKKAIPKLEECLNEYDKMTIPQKNETLKSIIKRVTYSKTKRLNWRKKEEDDLELVIELKI